MINSARAVRRKKAKDGVDVFLFVKDLALKFLDQAKGQSKKDILELFKQYQGSWEKEMKSRNKLGKPLYLKKEGLKEYVLGIERHLKTIGCPIEMQKEYKKVIDIMAGGKVNIFIRKIKNFIYEKETN